MFHGLEQPHTFSNSSVGRGEFSSKRKIPAKLRQAGKCFKCLAADHCVADYRDPMRCITCERLGHRARHCKGAYYKDEGERSINMNGENPRRGRVRSMKAYIPYTEEFLRRTELRWKSLLVDVVQPGDLGHAPLWIWWMFGSK